MTRPLVSRRLSVPLLALCAAACAAEEPQAVLLPTAVELTLSQVAVDRAAPLAADGVDVATVTVLLRDAAWQPLAGEQVSLTASHDRVVVGAPAVTGADGRAQLEVTGRTAGPVSLTALVHTAGGRLALAQEVELAVAAVEPGRACLADGGCVTGLCVRGGCRAPCGERGRACADGWACVGEACVPEAVATLACAGASVAGADGQCYPPGCGSSACGPYELCAAGVCVDKRCAGQSCAAGAICLAGACVSDVAVVEAAGAGATGLVDWAPQALEAGARLFALRVAQPVAALRVRTVSLSDFGGDLQLALEHPSGLTIALADYPGDEETVAVFDTPPTQSALVRDVGLPAGTYLVRVRHLAGEPRFRLIAELFSNLADGDAVLP